MLVTDATKTEILVKSVSPKPLLAVVTYETNGIKVMKGIALSDGFDAVVIKAKNAKVLSVSHIVIEKKLKEGEHHTPPKEYREEGADKRSDYAVPEGFVFPINDEEHTRAAIGYFHKHRFDSASQKKEAAKRILRAAKKFGIEVGEKDDVYRAAHGK